MTETLPRSAHRPRRLSTGSLAVDVGLIAALIVLALMLAATLVGISIPEVLAEFAARF